MARFCLATGLSPADYKALTVAEFEGFKTELKRRQRK
jgi:hypothetical protein